jgi:hypothetical protein
MKSLAIAVSAAVLLSSCAAYRAQHARPDAPASRSASTAATTASVMPDSRTMNALASQPLAVKQTLLISEVDRYIDELKQAGQYDCCVKPACRQCAITAGECHCREVVEKDGPCCGECTQGWVEGRGQIPGVDREQVLAHLGCVRELYEKKVPEGVAAPAQRKDQDEHKHH